MDRYFKLCDQLPQLRFISFRILFWLLVWTMIFFLVLWIVNYFHLILNLSGSKNLKWIIIKVRDFFSKDKKNAYGYAYKIKIYIQNIIKFVHTQKMCCNWIKDEFIVKINIDKMYLFINNIINNIMQYNLW